MSSRRGSHRVYTDMYGECYWLSDEKDVVLRLERFRLNGCDAPYEFDAKGAPYCMKCGMHNMNHPYADNKYCEGSNARWYYLEPPATDEWLDLLTIMAT